MSAVKIARLTWVPSELPRCQSQGEWIRAWSCEGKPSARPQCQGTAASPGGKCQRAGMPFRESLHERHCLVPPALPQCHRTCFCHLPASTGLAVIHVLCTHEGSKSCVCPARHPARDCSDKVPLAGGAELKGRTGNCSFSPSVSAHLPFTSLHLPTCGHMCSHTQVWSQNAELPVHGNGGCAAASSTLGADLWAAGVWRREGDCLCSKPRLHSLAE